MTDSLTVLVVGATGSIGRHVVAEAVRHGHTTRALVWPESDASRPDSGADIVTGDLTDASTLTAPLDGADAVVFTQGSVSDPEAVDFGAVARVLDARGDLPIRISLMTAIGVTVRSTGHDWKRRGERLVRASENDYTIVRPGWFDYNDDDQQRITMLQGDTRRAGDPSDGAVSRTQIARVLVDALTSERAARKTLELVAAEGPEEDDLDPVFAAFDTAPKGSLDGVRDPDNFTDTDFADIITGRN